MPKTIGTLFTESRLIAKTINRITVESDRVELNDWRNEAKLLASPGGSCLSSTTLLVKGKHVPTYGFDGRCYGFLFNAEECNIYDVSTTDSNSNRTSKLAKRTERKGVDMLTSNTVGAKTLDELAVEVKGGRDGQMQGSRYLVKDFGTSKSPKSTRQRAKYFGRDCPASGTLR